MERIVTRFVKYPFYGKMIIAVLLIAGLTSLAFMKKSFFPQTESKTITVSMVYPGASPKEVEEGITSRIEDAIRGIVGIKEMNSVSSEGFSRVTITTTGEYDLDETLADIKNAVDGIPSFPTGAEKAVIAKRRSTTPAINMVVTGDVELLTLKRYADEIYDDLLRSKKMSQINLSGFPRLELSVEVKEENLRRYNLTFSEISNAISSNNIDISGGTIKNEVEEILIRSRNRSVDPDKIGEIILKANPDGSYLRIRDVASTHFQFQDVPNSTFVNQNPAVYIVVNKLNNEDLKEISEFCNEYVEKFNASHDDAQMIITFDFVDMLKSRLNLLYENGGYGLGLVVIALAFFLSFRLALWVAWGIPASFLGMFIIANLMGVTINMISLFGMILIIGILVDDGIVIGENIYSHFEKGKSPRRAAIDGTLEVIPAVLTSVTTTMVAFSPLLLVSGNMEFLYEMAFVVCGCLFLSLFESFFVLPSHVGNEVVLNVKKNKNAFNRLRGRIEKGIIHVRDKVYADILNWVVEWRWFVVVTPVALILITYGLFSGGIIKSTFFPNMPFDSFNINVAFKPGSNKDVTTAYLKDFEKAVWEVNDEIMKEFSDTSAYIQYTGVSTGSSFSGQENGPHAGNMWVMLRDMEGAPLSSFDITTRVKKKIGNVPEAEKFTIGAFNRWGAPVSVSLLGSDLDELNRANLFFQDELRKIASLYNISDNNPLGSREVRLRLKPKAYYLGMDLRTITSQIRQGFFGGQAQRLQEGKDEIKVWVRYPKSDRVFIGQMEDMRIRTPKGEFPLSELIEYDIQRGPVSIQRYNGSREIRVEAELLDPNEPVPPILEFIEANIFPELDSRFPGVRTEYQGQEKRSKEDAEELSLYFSIAFMIIIFIVMIHFRSFTQGMIVLLMVPLGFLGSAWGHGIEGFPVSMLSVWGMVALSGVIINDAVVFLSKYNSLIQEGMVPVDAVKAAGKARFRAIVLTTITTSVGLYPLILENSFQAKFLIPMAIALAYGVLIGTMFILLFFPVLIMILNDIKRYSKQFWEGYKIDARDVEPKIKESKIRLD
ncbi:efflux RND transporter permease subunit [Marinifilum caeruleilacunae]|uniref:Efflux RND transporter permease subunit n=1 Tax=Marinifilum caeruleilacunae TaxID=2499076 RepID=A0ABX1WWR6_9BACT|nr:efflux RND transporter permease subunit [Marinifilum caeruleilacunae]NOU60376.1 efflux RND transporter permease subunit [Marinifilum caeruleilacunae]